MNTKKRFLETAARALGTKASRLTLRSTRAGVGGWDSLGHLKLFLALEREFGADFPANRIMRYKNLGEIYADLEKKAR